MVSTPYRVCLRRSELEFESGCNNLASKSMISTMQCRIEGPNFTTVDYVCLQKYPLCLLYCLRPLKCTAVRDVQVYPGLKCKALHVGPVLPPGLLHSHFAFL